MHKYRKRKGKTLPKKQLTTQHHERHLVVEEVLAVPDEDSLEEDEQASAANVATVPAADRTQALPPMANNNEQIR